MHSGTHGAIGAEYRTEHADYSKVVIAADPIDGIYFGVFKKNGQIWQYGAIDWATNSRAKAPRQRRTVDGTPETVGDTVTFAWALARILDRSSNSIEFWYEPDPEAPTTLLPSSIQYGDTTQSQATREISFVYEERSDARRGYVSGVATGITQRVSRIDVYGPTPAAGGQTTKELLWSYDLSYEQGPVTGRSRLNRVEWCDGGGVCLPSTLIDWQQETLDYVVSGGTGTATGGVGWSRDAENQPQVLTSWVPLLVADVTGDGNDDLVYSGPPFQIQGGYRGLGTGKIRVSDGFGGFENERIFTGPGIANINIWRSRPVDFDNDGRVDLIAAGVFAGVGYQLVSWDPGVQRMVPRGEFFETDFLTKHFLLGDINGDARLDLVHAVDNEWAVRLNESSQTGEPTFGSPILTGIIAGVEDPRGDDPLSATAFTDQDGDGRGELHVRPGRRPHSTFGLDKDGQPESFIYDREEWLQNPEARHPLGTDSTWRFIDLNGDGLEDVVGITNFRGGAPTFEARINTGLGYGEVYQPGNPEDVRIGRDNVPIPLVDEGYRILDFNGDGLEDIFVFDAATRPTNLDVASTAVAQTNPPHVLLSDGAYFTRVDLPATGAQRVLEYPIDNPEGGWSSVGCGWCSSQVGDVDGNGTQDIVQLVRESGQWKFQILRRDQRAPADLVRAVRTGVDQTVSAEVAFDVLAAAGSREATANEVPNLTLGELTNRPFYERAQTCTPTLSCVTRGVTAVHAYRSRAAHGHDRNVWYRYSGARADTGGRGFLGFDSVTVMDEVRKSGTRIEYNNTERLSLATGYAFPFAMLVKNSVSIVPIDPNASPPQFHVQHSTFVHRARTIDASYDAHVTRQDMYFGVQETPSPPFATEIHRYVNSTYDDFGNLAARTVGTVGGAEEHIHVLFDNDTERWLIGLARRREIISTIPSSSGTMVETRTTSFDYHPISGLLQQIHREPDLLGTPDPELRYLRTTIGRGDYGLITTVTQTGDPASSAYWKGDSAPRITKIEYDAHGVYPRRVKDALGLAQSVAYHPSFGVPLVAVDANGGEIRWKYDGFGRVRQITPAGGERRDVDYLPSSVGEIEVRTTYAGGAKTYVHLDALGRERMVTRLGNEGETVRVERNYDHLGRVSWELPPDVELFGARAYRYEYDNLDRLVRLTNPDDSIKTRSYLGLTSVTEIDEAGNRSELLTNVDGQLVESSNYVVEEGVERAITTRFTYATFGLVQNIVREAAGEEVTTTYGYDRLGRRVSLFDPDSGERRHGYNAFDELQSETNADDETTSFSHDRLGRVTLETRPDSLTTSFVWDTALHGLGKLSHVIAPNGVRSEYLYDEQSRPRGKRLRARGRTFAVDTTYDALGRPSQVSYPEYAGTPRLTVEYEYNQFGYLEKLVDPRTPDNPIWSVQARNLFGQVTSATFGSDTTLERVFTPHTSRLESIHVTRAEVDLQNVFYSYKPDGGLEEVEDQVRGTRESLIYDGLDRLTGWQQEALPGRTAPTFAFTYAYDDLGNPTTTSDGGGGSTARVYNRTGNAGPHAATDFGDLSYSYDTLGRMKQRLRGGTAELEFHYTHFDLPARIDHALQPELTTSFEYDGEQNRVIKETSESRTFYMEQLFELHQDLTAPGTSPETAVFHIFAEGGEVARIVRNSGEETLSFVHQDRLGSVVAVSAAGATSSEPEDVQRVRFDPFGQVVDDAGAPTGAPSTSLARGFTGHEHDADLGLINMGGRIYDPLVRRFLTPDPVVQAPSFGQSHNPYSYAFNNPFRYIDSSGFASEYTFESKNYPDDGNWHPDGKEGYTCKPNGPGTCDESKLPDSDKSSSASEKQSSAATETGPANTPSPGGATAGSSSEFGFAQPEVMPFVASDPGPGHRWNPYDPVTPGTSLFGAPYEKPEHSPVAHFVAMSIVEVTFVGDLVTLADPQSSSFQRTVAAGTLVLTVVTAGVGTIVIKGAAKVIVKRAARGGSRLVMGAGRASRFPATARAGDVTLDRNPAVLPDIIADYTKPLGDLPGAPYPEVLFERVPSFTLTPQAATNAYNALRAGGQVEILTGAGNSAAATTRAIEQTFRAAGFCGVGGTACTHSGLVRVIGTK